MRAAFCRYRCLAPAVRDGLEQPDQCRGGRDDDRRPQRVVEQFWPLGEGAAQELIAGQKQHRKFRGCAGTAPSRPWRRVRARVRQPAGRGAPALCAQLFGRRIDRPPGRHPAASWHRSRGRVPRACAPPDRAAAVARRRRAWLLGEIAVLGQARQFDHAAQRQLAPATAHLRPPQRRDQVAGFALQRRLPSARSRSASAGAKASRRSRSIAATCARFSRARCECGSISA